MELVSQGTGWELWAGGLGTCGGGGRWVWGGGSPVLPSAALSLEEAGNALCDKKAWQIAGGWAGSPGVVAEPWHSCWTPRPPPRLWGD